MPSEVLTESRAAAVATDATGGAITVWLHDQWELVHGQWVGVPAVLRTLWEQLGERLRDAFDLPTKHELNKLSARLDDIDTRLAALIEARAGVARAQAAAVAAGSIPAPSGNGAHPIQSHVKARAEKRVRKS